MRALLVLGVDTNISTHDGKRALDYALTAGRWDLVAALDPTYPLPHNLADSAVAAAPISTDSPAHLLDALALGEREAGHVGVDVERLKRRLVTQVALAVGASVAISGTVGFVGLVAPHIVRLLLGPAHRTLLPAAALFGGAFVVLADALARTVVSPAELPIGVLTALVGGPFFLWLLAGRAARGDL